jgi:hypothetical protein
VNRAILDAYFGARTIPELDQAVDALMAWVEAHPEDANMLELGDSIEARRANILAGPQPEPAWRAGKEAAK